MKANLDSNLTLVIAHQIKNSLATNKWTIRELLDGSQGALTSPQKDVVTSIYEHNEQIIKLIEKIFRADKEGSSALELHKTSVDITGLIQKIVDETRTEAMKKNLTVHLDRPDSLPSVYVDAEKISYVFENIIDNALRYTTSGGTIRIVIIKDQESVVVEVTDSGLGIPTAEQSKIFTKFFRASNMAEIGREGTGLGLFMSKNIIELHGGKIWFESQEGKGSVFRVSLPLDKMI